MDTIVSPFDNSGDSNEESSGDDPVATLPDVSDKGPLELTWDNVELVLDDMRPYLIQDGGNVAITEIDGPVVLLELQGACGTCPSSTVRTNTYSIVYLVWYFKKFWISQETNECSFGQKNPSNSNRDFIHSMNGRTYCMILMCALFVCSSLFYSKH